MKKYFLVIIFLIMIAGCSISIRDKSEDKTNELYLIPSGFEGSIIVFYNVPNKPKLEKEGKYSVIPVKLEYLKALEGTEIHQYGIYITSTPDIFTSKPYMDSATVNNKYYYIDKNGDRTAIDEQCTNFSTSGSFTGDNGKEIDYQSIQITKSHCGEAFYHDGLDIYNTQKKEVIKYWRDDQL